MGYSVDGRKWASGDCRLNLGRPGIDVTWRSCAKNAMALWNGASANFKFTEDPTARDDIDAYDNGRWNGWLGMTWTSPTASGSHLLSVRTVINLFYEWSPAHPHVLPSDTAGPYNLETAMAHEFGHALHLGEDTSGARTMMHPTICPGEVRGLHSDDIAGVRHLY